jgi:beta-glucosidase
VHHARQAAARENEFHLGFFADPIFLKQYPAKVEAFFKERGVVHPQIESDDFETIAQPIDFLGLNFYYPTYKKNSPGNHWPLEHKGQPVPGATAARHTIAAEGLLDLCKWVKARYNTPVVITENGTNEPDEPDEHGQVNDDHRIAYVHKHLQACKKAIDAGVDVRGYIAWTWLDNYEWGDWSRMGFVWSDFETQRRIVKKSGRWFADGIRKGFLAP